MPFFSLPNIISRTIWAGRIFGRMARWLHPTRFCHHQCLDQQHGVIKLNLMAEEIEKEEEEEEIISRIWQHWNGAEKKL